MTTEAGMPLSHEQERDIERHAELIFRAAREAGVDRPVFELRCMKFVTEQSYKGGGTNAGWFDNPSGLAIAGALLDRRSGRGIYVTLNPTSPALLARAANRLMSRCDSTTDDAGIEKRIFLLVDIDPTRPSGISSSDEEHQFALSLALHIRETLMTEGWPEPLSADSGNGAHLVWRIDLPNDVDADALIHRVLDALAARFDTNEAKVDRTVFNSSRITKLYGTMTRKGDSLPDRPHRISQLLEVPDALIPVAREQLHTVADTLPQVSTAAKSSAAPRTRRSSSGAFGALDLDAFISRHSLKVASTKIDAKGRRILVLATCPFDASHSGDGGGGGSAVITQDQSGMLGFKCHHNACQGHGWRALRQLFEPKRMKKRAPITKSAKRKLLREQALDRVRNIRLQRSRSTESSKEIPS